MERGGLGPPLRMISHRNYLSWSGAENRDKDRDTLIEQSLCSELCKDFYVVYQLEMVAGEVESSCQLVVTFFFSFFGLTLPNYRNKSGSAQPPSYQLLPPPLQDPNTPFSVAGQYE